MKGKIMALKKFISMDTPSTHDFKTNKTISGYYLGTKETKNGPLHVVRPKGTTDNIGVWGSAQIDQFISTLQKQGNTGAFVEITFLKKIKAPKGEMKVFDFAFDDSDIFTDIGSVSAGTTDLETVEAVSDSEEDTVTADEAEALLQGNS